MFSIIEDATFSAPLTYTTTSVDSTVTYGANSSVITGGSILSSFALSKTDSIYISEKEFETFYDVAKTHVTVMPNVVGMPAMDALALLENMGLNVKIQGVGIVKAQSVEKGIKVKKNQTVVLEI